MKRIKGMAQREAKPLLKEDLFSTLEMTGHRMKDRRDRALLLLGFAGGFRRSELVGLNVEDVAFDRKGVIVTIRRTKTDQEGKGRKLGIPFGRARWCPVKALEEWLEAAEIPSGPIFRPVSRHSQVGMSRLTGEALSIVVKEWVAKIGQTAELFSGDSWRAGFGHTSDAMLSRYIQAGGNVRRECGEPRPC
ncbi:site-specific integrase [Agrobacterium albertimagni]|nr:site-specific integrase [Agrobacterium albertimagni]